MTIASIANFLGPNGGIILLGIVLLFGAKKLPELARALGQSIREFSAGKDGLLEDKSTAATNQAAPSKNAS